LENKAVSRNLFSDLVAMTSDAAETGAALNALGGTCSGYHEAFRAPKK
jgi:cytochrome c556